MLRDRYGNEITTTSQTARDAYDAAVETFLAAGPNGVEAFEAVVEADPQFMLGHLGLARTHQMFGRRDACRAALAQARGCADSLTAREASQLHAMGLILEGKGAEALPLIRAHLTDWPRDVTLAQPLMGVFGLIGFSGQPGREAEMLAVAEWLAPHYPDDFWFLGFFAFAQLEVGQLAAAETNVERALALNPASANSAHVKAHWMYESGETAAGRAFLSDWMAGYDRTGLMHCHNAWHVALWALASGDEAGMWAAVDADLSPGVSLSPPLNIVTDLAALYYRAEMAGLSVPETRWQEISRYAAETFPNPGLQFADMHTALAHAMAGNGEALDRIIRDARGPAADMVREIGGAFGALARGDWDEALSGLVMVMGDHARMGGSRAQRDLIEFATATALIRLGRGEEAARLMAIRRPKIDYQGALAGLPALH